MSLTIARSRRFINSRDLSLPYPSDDTSLRETSQMVSMELASMADAAQFKDHSPLPLPAADTNESFGDETNNQLQMLQAEAALKRPERPATPDGTSEVATAVPPRRAMSEHGGDAAAALSEFSGTAAGQPQTPPELESSFNPEKNARAQSTPPLRQSRSKTRPLKFAKPGEADRAGPSGQRRGSGSTLSDGWRLGSECCRVIRVRYADRTNV